MKKASDSYDKLKYLRLLAREYPSIAEVCTEIVNLKAILCLPKGTEHFISDIHGEYEAFLHMLKNASGVVREKIDLLYEDKLPLSERNMLATLIYYPEAKLDELAAQGVINGEWLMLTISRLVEICRVSASKYTRSKVRKALPRGFEYIIEELLHATDNSNQAGYNREVVNAIIETERAEDFIIAISGLIQRLVIDKLHIVGDIFDRGPGAHIIMDALESYHQVDIQWGNHDLLWMGAAAGCSALVATTIVNSLKYGNLDTIEDGYGISLSPLVSFALEVYGDDPCYRFMPREIEASLDSRSATLIAKMHKALAIILFKLEGEIIDRNPAFGMERRKLLHRMNLKEGTVELEDGVYPLSDTYFPTLDPADPYRLTPGEEEVIDKLTLAFDHSQKLQRHVEFLYSRGSMYLCCNDFLLFHGCIPSDENGEFSEVELFGKRCSGRELFDRADALARQGYFAREGTPERQQGLDFLWYCWCGKLSPVFGKNRMTTFERYFVADKDTHTETKNPYFTCGESPEFALKILREFGIESEEGRIINGHVPVKIKKGENPIKAGGRIIVIDGGMSKPYQLQTGAAGYTLISSSTGITLSCHEPFVTAREAISTEADIHSSQTLVESYYKRRLVSDTDDGRAIKERVKDLKSLLEAYRTGLIKGAKV
ncbi:MAG: fructose-1,6-bisphosphatase [Oscillospiraceae bacterium]|nr:fructose-1,6-bisphosphatase [Oscillospiraceae bacterium]